MKKTITVITLSVLISLVAVVILHYMPFTEYHKGYIACCFVVLTSWILNELID